MKKCLFHHPAPSCHTVLKWLICGLFSFFTGFAAAHAATVSPSGSGTGPAVSSGKQPAAANRHGNAPYKRTASKTAAADWQKRKPFVQSGTPASGKKTSRKTAPWRLPDTLRTANGIDKNTLELAAAASKPAYTPAEKQVSDLADPTETNEGYTIGPARFTVNYEKTNDRDHGQTTSLLTGDTVCDINCSDIVESHNDRDNFHFGMEYTSGNGRINASLDIVRMKNARKNDSDNPDATDLKTLSIGYTYDMSDNTSLYGAIARTEYDRQAIAGNSNASGEDSITGLRVGITHRF